MRIILIGEDGNKIGEVDKNEAERMARTANKSLIMLDGRNHVYKIADAGKLKYEQKQKEKIQRAQQRTHKIKEIQLTPVIGDHDLDVKMEHAREFLSKGLKTKLVMKFKRRQITHPEIGVAKLNKLIDTLKTEGIAAADKAPVFEGRDLIVFLTPIKG